MESLKDKDVQGLKYFTRLLPLLDRLHDVGCKRDVAGNRQLFFNDYAKLVLLYMWNPLIGSLRTLQQAISLPKVFKVLGIRRFSLGSFSEAPAVFDPQLLRGVIDELAGELRPLSVSVFEALEERELSQAALDAGIVRDAIVRLGGADAAMSHPVRLVELQVTPRPRRSRKPKKQTHEPTPRSDRLLIVTDMTALEAELVALVYRQRYSVELFFRFFKQILGMRHLISQRQEGVEIQVYCAVIACLMIQLQTGKKPDKRTAEMMGWFFLGLASEQDVIDHLNKPDNKGVKLKAKDALWKKLGF